jgi:hypothetical protein
VEERVDGSAIYLKLAVEGNDRHNYEYKFIRLMGHDEGGGEEEPLVDGHGLARRRGGDQGFLRTP